MEDMDRLMAHRAKLRKIPQGPEALHEAIPVLRAGGVVALPTDTLYGLAADAFSEAGTRRVQEIKGDRRGRPISLLIDSVERGVALLDRGQESILEKASRYWPGPLTVIVRARRDILLPSAVMSAAGGIGLRVPDNEFLAELIRFLDRPLTGTSANPSGAPSPRTAEDVERVFKGRTELPDLLIDGGACPGGTESTVLSFLEEKPRVLRRGAIPDADLRF